MKTTRWLFVVSAALFISGIGFVIASARTDRLRDPVKEPVVLRPVASIKQIMAGITSRAANDVWGAIGTIVDATGVHEHAPQTDEEWAAVGNSAAALVESANLLMMEGRAVDKGAWMKFSTELADASTLALKGAESKNGPEVVSAGERIYQACDGCHQRYQRN